MERLFYAPARGSTPPRSNASAAWFESVDGTRLYGWWIAGRPPEGPSDELLPTIIHAHGNAGNLRDHEWFSSHFPPAGFNVFVFDYRGFGQSEGAARDRRRLTEDVVAAIDYVASRDDVDRSRIGLYGQSLGGALALNAVVKHPADIRAVLLESPFASWRAVAANAVSRSDPPGWFGRVLASILIADHDAPIDAIATLQQPILIVHGDRDSIVPISHSYRLRDAARATVTLHVVQGGDHNTLKETNPEVETMMITFFQTHLSASDKP